MSSDGEHDGRPGGLSSSVLLPAPQVIADGYTGCARCPRMSGYECGGLSCRVATLSPEREAESFCIVFCFDATNIIFFRQFQFWCYGARLPRPHDRSYATTSHDRTPSIFPPSARHKSTALMSESTYGSKMQAPSTSLRPMNISNRPNPDGIIYVETATAATMPPPPSNTTSGPNSSHSHSDLAGVLRRNQACLNCRRRKLASLPFLHSRLSAIMH